LGEETPFKEKRDDVRSRVLKPGTELKRKAYGDTTPKSVIFGLGWGRELHWGGGGWWGVSNGVERGCGGAGSGGGGWWGGVGGGGCGPAQLEERNFNVPPLKIKRKKFINTYRKV